MAAVRAKDTKPELALRRALHARGLRYRLHDKTLPGRPDIVFAAARVAVFVDGDFWHGGGWQARRLAGFEDQFPNNRDFWVKKISRNVARDEEVNDALARAGWFVIRALESKVNSDVGAQAALVEQVVSGRRSRASQLPPAS